MTKAYRDWPGHPTPLVQDRILHGASALTWTVQTSTETKSDKGLEGLTLSPHTSSARSNLARRLRFELDGADSDSLE